MWKASFFLLYLRYFIPLTNLNFLSLVRLCFSSFLIPIYVTFLLYHPICLSQDIEFQAQKSLLCGFGKEVLLRNFLQCSDIFHLMNMVFCFGYCAFLLNWFWKPRILLPVNQNTFVSRVWWSKHMNLVFCQLFCSLAEDSRWITLLYFPSNHVMKVA